MTRAEFCRRMMPALRLAAKQGYIRNDARTREALGYELSVTGSKHLGNRLCGYANDGLLIAATSAGNLRRIYRLTTRGKLALSSNGQHAQRHTVSARLADFIQANPDEELSADDVCVKFDCSIAQARRAVAYLVSIGRAERVKVVRAARPRVVAERRAA